MAVGGGQLKTISISFMEKVQQINVSITRKSARTNRLHRNSGMGTQMYRFQMYITTYIIMLKKSKGHGRAPRATQKSNIDYIII